MTYAAGFIYAMRPAGFLSILITLIRNKIFKGRISKFTQQFANHLEIKIQIQNHMQLRKLNVHIACNRYQAREKRYHTTQQFNDVKRGKTCKLYREQGIEKNTQITRAGKLA